ncbi:MAG: hypothetical protein KDI59_00055 [Xanthomonadales bacterium]|nr:hypothetical protein [Xanthomonadales bacterium]
MIDYDYIEFSGVFHIPQNNIRYVIEEQKCFFLFDDICKGVNLDNNHSDFIKGLLAKFEDICVEEEINIEDSISYNIKNYGLGKFFISSVEVAATITIVQILIQYYFLNGQRVFYEKDDILKLISLTKNSNFIDSLLDCENKKIENNLFESLVLQSFKEMPNYLKQIESVPNINFLHQVVTRLLPFSKNIERDEVQKSLLQRIFKNRKRPVY